MTVVPVQTALFDESLLAVKIATYARIVGLSECVIYGVNDGVSPSQCDPVWSHAQRIMLFRYLLEAQSEIESITGFYLQPTYSESEQHLYRFPLVTKWSKVIQIGTQTITTISLNEAIDYMSDPAVIGPVATTVTDIDEIAVYHPGTEVQVIPSSIVISGGFVTIEIPRCRLVNEASQENPETGWDYNDVPPSASSPFEDVVDVKRIYYEESTGAELVYPHRSSDDTCTICNTTCDEFVHPACGYIRKPMTGVVDILKADRLTSFEWTLPACAGRRANYARLDYVSGMNPTSFQMQEATIRLAHSKSPFKPCSCETANFAWERDRHIPDTITSERARNVFGLSDGAWFAFQQANSAKVFRSGVL